MVYEKLTVAVALGSFFAVLYILILNSPDYLIFYARLFKSFEFVNGSRMSDENLVILEFNYLQNKKW